MRYKRLLLKISGEALLGKQAQGIDQEALMLLAHRLSELKIAGHEVAVVLGGGNIFRGLQGGSTLKIDRTPADQMGMLATILNGIALEQALKKAGSKALLMSALECPAVATTYQWEKASEALAEGYILIFVGGTGHPYFTTDTAAALRASEIQADLFLKATTRVDGVYDKDPLVHKEAKKYDRISYQDFVEKKLAVMDLTSVALCLTNQIPVRVFNLHSGSFIEAASEGNVGTLIGGP